MISLVCGRSRSGKTTYAKRFENVMHLDSFGILPKNYGKVLDKVSTIDYDIVIDGIYDTAKARIDLLDAYKSTGERICIWIDTPIDVIERRFAIVPSKHPYPFEPPTLSEGWDEIIIIRGDDNVECHRR